MNVAKRTGAMRCILLCTAVLAIACGPLACRSRGKQLTQPVQADPEIANRESLSDRSYAYWQAKVDDDCATIFAFRDPVRREGYTAEQYCAWHKDSEPFEVHAFTIQDVVADDDIGWIDLENTVRLRRVPVAKPVTARRWEKWMRVDADWYPVPKDAQDNFPVAPALRDLEEEKLLMERFTDSWNARLEGDWERLYALTDPEDLETVSIDQFSETHSLIGYQHYVPLWVQAIDDHGIVRTKVTHKVNDPSLTKMPPTDVTLNERWIKRDGVWYMDLDPGK
jgi:hypothetical protein